MTGTSNFICQSGDMTGTSNFICRSGGMTCTSNSICYSGGVMDTFKYNNTKAVFRKRKSFGTLIWQN